MLGPTLLQGAGSYAPAATATTTAGASTLAAGSRSSQAHPFAMAARDSPTFIHAAHPLVHSSCIASC